MEFKIQQYNKEPDVERRKRTNDRTVVLRYNLRQTASSFLRSFDHGGA